MSTQKTENLPYMASVKEADGPNAFRITYVPNGQSPEPGPNGIRQRVPQHIVVMQGLSEATTFAWQGDPLPEAIQQTLEGDARKRLEARREWVARVTALVSQVEEWARELGWDTRRIEKKLKDSRVGNHVVPALLMQDDTVRLLLDPIARTAPGAKGLVDLYLMPGYDDVASLYFRHGAWQLHYIFPGSDEVATTKDAEAKALTKETIEAVFAEMKQHGG